MIPLIKFLLTGQPGWFTTLFPFALAYLYLSAYKNPLQSALTQWVDDIHTDRGNILANAVVLFLIWIASIVRLILS